MRELKFRAWQIKEKRMYKVWSIFWYDNTLGIDVYGLENREDTHEDITNFEIMQYTGLKDKNGKDIYEGDIIKGLTWKEPYAMRHSKECIGQVIYTNDYGFCFSTKGINGEYRGLPNGYRTYPSLTRSEIIGNIYENPDLLGEINE